MCIYMLSVQKRPILLVLQFEISECPAEVMYFISQMPTLHNGLVLDSIICDMAQSMGKFGCSSTLEYKH